MERRACKASFEAAYKRLADKLYMETALQENDHILIQFPRDTDIEHVKEVMLKRAAENCDFALDEAECLKTLRQRRDTIMFDTYQMLIKGIGVL